MSDEVSAAPLAIEIRQVEVAEIIGVRHRVLRVGRPIETAHFADDGVAGTMHLALMQNQEARGAVSLHPRDCARHRGPAVWQLRGMAVDTELQGRGYGTLLLHEAFTSLRAAGAEVVWCNARILARTLYERAEMQVHGDVFDIVDVGPHVFMSRSL